MTDHIPEEVLGNILGFLLLQPLETFCAWPASKSKRRPVALDSEDTSRTLRHDNINTPSRVDVLLVSRKWRRVGTPLLYESVKLRTPEHVQGLHDLLTTDSSIRMRIRRLRLECTESEALAKVMELCPKIDTLFISTPIYSSMKVDGIVTALRQSKLSLRYLYLHEKPRTEYENTRKIEEAIADAKDVWSTLTCFALSHSCSIPKLFVEPLANAPNLKEICIGGSTSSMSLMDDSLREIAQNPTLETIRCQDDAQHAFYCEQHPGVSRALMLMKWERTKGRT